MKNWYVWERPAVLHFIYAASEGVSKPFTNEYGLNWPTAYGFYEKGMLRYAWDQDEMTETGKLLIEKFLKKDYYQKKFKRWDMLTKTLKESLLAFDLNNLSKISNSEFVKKFENLHKKHIEWWALGQVAEHIAFGGESILKEKLSKSNFEKYFSILVSPTIKSYNYIAEDDLLKILLKIQENKIKNFPKNTKIEKLIKDHTKKYHWINNSFHEAIYLGGDFFIKELKHLVKDKVDAKNDLKKRHLKFIGIKKRKNNAIKKLGFDKKTVKIIKLIEDFCDFQDFRKAIMQQVTYHIDLLLKEAAGRSKIDKSLVNWATPYEIRKILDKKFDAKILKERKKFCVFIITPETDKLSTGRKAKEFEQDFSSRMYNREEVDELEGLTAQPGLVTGIVKIILKPDSKSKIRKKDILVTTMTSPDFLPLMRKCAAIVTDEGGITCHAAIVSRELGIPCVIGTKMATRLLKNGDFVEVDANNGVVKKV